jgi:hypothetical protein
MSLTIKENDELRKRRKDALEEEEAENAFADDLGPKDLNSQFEQVILESKKRLPKARTREHEICHNIFGRSDDS